MHRPAKFKNFLLHCINLRAPVLVDTRKRPARQNPAHPMQAFYSDQFVLPLPPGHRFPMPKYRLLRERIDGEPGIRLLTKPYRKQALAQRIREA